MIRFDRLKDGKKYAVTLSYDDGRESDRRLVGIMNQYGIRGTFHLNSGNLDYPGMISKDELQELYKNHEVSCHGALHRTLNILSPQNIAQEVLEDRLALEQASGNFVRGMSYANGIYSDEIISVLKSCGIIYSRTTQNTGSFTPPLDFMKWHPTSHHKDCIESAERFLNLIGGYFPFPRILYIWGHSYEFDRENNWDLIEKFCQMVGGREEIWYATNIELCEYMLAQRQIVVSVDNKRVYNPTATKIWFTDDGKEYSVAPGETVVIK